jgi:hypothetical protein
MDDELPRRGRDSFQAVQFFEPEILQCIIHLLTGSDASPELINGTNYPIAELELSGHPC